RLRARGTLPSKRALQDRRPLRARAVQELRRRNLPPRTKRRSRRSRRRRRAARVPDPPAVPLVDSRGRRCVRGLSRRRPEYGSARRQRWLIEHGRVRAGTAATERAGPSPRSYHQEGLAADLAFVDNDGNLTRAAGQPWRELGEIGESVGLDWGGRQGGDPTHFQ